MRKGILVLLLLLALLASFFYVSPGGDVSAQDNWVISGDKVFIDDSNAYLSATPHTLGSSGWVEFELQSKNYSGAIDAVWGFNLADGVKPTRPQIWAANIAHEVYDWVEVEEDSTYTFNDVISFTPLFWEGNDPDVGNSNNQYLVELTYFDMGRLATSRVGYSSYYYIGDTYYFSLLKTNWEKSYYTEYYDDWSPFLQGIEVVSRNLASMDTWYVVKGATLQAGITYKVRAWVDIPFAGCEQSAGKYVWGVKPSSETIAEARTSGHLYLLDPWWDASWLYKRKITFTNGAQSENLTNFPVLFHFADPTIDFDKIKAAGADIRFVDDDDSTPLDYEIEEWDDGGKEAWVWVEVPQINASDNTDFIYIYYGNDAATDDQDATSVWSENYISVYHLAEGAGNAVDSADGNPGAVDGATQGAAGKIFDAYSFDGDNDKVVVSDNANLSSLGAMSIEAWIKHPLNGYEGIISKDTGSNPDREFIFLLYNNNGELQFILSSADIANRLNTLATNDISDGNWKYVVATWDGVNDAGHIKLWVNAVEEVLVQDSKSGTGYTPHDGGADVELGRFAENNDNCLAGVLDEVRISSTDRSGDWIAAQHLSMTDTFITVGAEEGGVVAPTVVTNAATSVEETTATLSGNITATGGANCTDRGFQWDTDTGVPYADNWTENGNYGVSNFTHGLTALTKGELYYYRAGANNTAGWGWGAEVTFLTKPDPPNTFVATGGDGKVDLTWSNGTGTDNTTITAKKDSYPANRADGTVVYDDTGESYTDNTPANGETWYYRAWAWCTEGGKEQYSDTYDEDYALAAALPTVTTQPASDIEDTTATGSGNITATGGDNCTERGFVWDSNSWGEPGNIDPGMTDYGASWHENGNYGVGNFTGPLTGCNPGVLTYYRAYSMNAVGYHYGNEVSFLTKPAAPTNVAATDGAHTDKVVVTWTKSTGATGYKVYEGANLLDTLGDVATFDDLTAPAGSITNSGNVTASDGTIPDYVNLSLANETTANGASRTYKVVAVGFAGDSDDSATDTGYRGVGAITYQWQMSDADADANYNTNLGTTDPYNATEAPVFPAARYFQCVVSSVDASNTPQTSTPDRGYRGAPPPPPPPSADPRDPDKVYLEFRPDLDETGMIKKVYVPTEVYPGIFFGYSLPVWTDKSANETLYFEMCVPDRWDGESDILVHVKVATSDNQTGNVYELELAWDKVTPNVVEAIPTGAPNLVSGNRTVDSELTYACYMDWFTLDYDVEVADPVIVDDTIAFRLRRFGDSDNLTSELIFFECSVLFARGDFMGDPTGNVEIIIDDLIYDGTLIGGEEMPFLVFGLICAIITYLAMRQRDYSIKILAGLLWAGTTIYWLTAPPSTVTAGDSTHTIWLIVFGAASAIMFINAYAQHQGSPFPGLARKLRGESEEELSEASRLSPSSSRDRRDTYRERANGAIRGRRTRR